MVGIQMKLILVTVFTVFARPDFRRLNTRFLLFTKYKKLDENNYFFTWKEK